MEEIKAAAQNHYTLLPYHNYEHALTVWENAQILIQRCKKYDISIDEEVIEIAVLFHDAGYEKETEFDSKEAYAAHIAEKELTKVRYNKITEVKKAIMATHKDVVAKTPEEKIVRAADLMGLAGPYEQFKDATQRLAKEKKLLTGTVQDIESWKNLVNHYFSQTIQLTPEFSTDAFHERFQENVRRYLEEEATRKI